MGLMQRVRGFCAPACDKDDQSGQMTVEFAVAFPVMIIVAVVAVNALLFFGECASFDRVARDAVRVYAASPAHGQGTEDVVACVSQAVEASAEADNLSTSLAVTSRSSGHTTYTATLKFYPTLFGLGLKSSVLGVDLPCLEHSVSMTIDVYKPGVVM